MELVDKIIYLRTEILQINEIEFANRCGVNRRTVYSWEHAISKPTLENLTAIATVCNVTLDYLLYNDKELELYISDVRDKSFEILKAIASEYQSLNKKKGVQNVR